MEHLRAGSAEIEWGKGREEAKITWPCVGSWWDVEKEVEGGGEEERKKRERNRLNALLARESITEHG